MANDGLSEAVLREALGARPFKFSVEAGSTNDIAREWALQGAQHGSIVITERQTAGRGRFGRNWSAPAGTALLFSTILRPRTTEPQKATMVGAVSVGEVLAELAPGKVSLKWPNDVLLDGYKVAGILPEAIWQGETLVAVILGIGLNVRVDFTDTPLINRATSIETVTGNTLHRPQLLASLLNRIDYWSMRTGDHTLFQTWRDWLRTLGQRVTVTYDGQKIEGEAVGVEEDGALILRTDDSKHHRVVAGEVTLSEQ